MVLPFKDQILILSQRISGLLSLDTSGMILSKDHWVKTRRWAKMPTCVSALCGERSQDRLNPLTTSNLDISTARHRGSCFDMNPLVNSEFNSASLLSYFATASKSHQHSRLEINHKPYYRSLLCTAINRINSLSNMNRSAVFAATQTRMSFPASKPIRVSTTSQELRLNGHRPCFHPAYCTNVTRISDMLPVSRLSAFEKSPSHDNSWVEYSLQQFCCLGHEPPFHH